MLKIGIDLGPIRLDLTVTDGGFGIMFTKHPPEPSPTPTPPDGEAKDAPGI